MERSGLPKKFWGFALTVYQPGRPRLMVVRAEATPPVDNVRRVVERTLAHPRSGEFDFGDQRRCRLQVDFIVDEPEPIDFATLSASSLDANRFEVGIDGLRIAGSEKHPYLLPGDAFAWSILSLNQLRQHIARLFRGTPLQQLSYYRFRSASYMSTADGWIRLYRGYPAVSPVARESLFRAAEAGVHSIVRNQQPDGRFLYYYYDAATDSCRDHEHPTRNPETDPYYNLLRHCGGACYTKPSAGKMGLAPAQGCPMPVPLSGTIRDPSECSTRPWERVECVGAMPRVEAKAQRISFPGLAIVWVCSTFATRASAPRALRPRRCQPLSSVSSPHPSRARQQCERIPG